LGRDREINLTSAGKILNNYGSAEEVEALALLHGAKLVNEWRLSPIILETDCASIVKATQEGDGNLSYLRSIILEFRDLVPEE
jgi:hypothetical protein